MVDLKTAAVVVGAGAAGLIILSRTDAAPQLGIKMPDISMPDIGIAFPNMEGIFEPFKNMFEGLKIPEFPEIPDFPSFADIPMPTSEGIKSIIQPIIDNIPTVDDIKGIVPTWVYDPPGIPDIPEITGLDKIRDVVQGGLVQIPIIGEFYKAPSWIGQELERAKDAVPTEPLTYAVDTLRSWAATLDPRR